MFLISLFQIASDWMLTLLPNRGYQPHFSRLDSGPFYLVFRTHGGAYRTPGRENRGSNRTRQLNFNQKSNFK